MQDWTQPRPQTQPSDACMQHVPNNFELEAKAWKFWELMLAIYSNRWEAKNGSAPSDLWIAQIGNLTSDQMTSVSKAMVARCASGNSWPPDLAEFVALVAEAGASRLGLKVADVMAEYQRWRNESYRYASTEEYFIARNCHPVLYQICTEMKRTGIERQMTESELEKLAGNQLLKWEKHLSDGYPIPPVRKQINRPRHPSGPTPAQLLKAQADAAKLRKI